MLEVRKLALRGVFRTDRTSSARRSRGRLAYVRWRVCHNRLQPERRRSGITKDEAVGARDHAGGEGFFDSAVAALPKNLEVDHVPRPTLLGPLREGPTSPNRHRRDLRRRRKDGAQIFSRADRHFALTGFAVLCEM